MPKRYRDPLVLFYLEGRTRNEVATILGLSLGGREDAPRTGTKAPSFPAGDSRCADRDGAGFDPEDARLVGR